MNLTSATPSGEQQRLDALYRYDILETPPEERFDRVARLAKRWFDVPIALITFLDEHREWFKSSIGVDRREVDREMAFCKYTIQGESIMVVEDATQDPRLSDNPLVTGSPGIRFYAGAPFESSDGYFLGALCVMDTEPHTVEDEGLETLDDLASIVSDELELRAINRELEERTRQAQSLTRALTEAEESERRRLSQLLHDDLQQILQAVRMKLEQFGEKGSLSAEDDKRAAQIRMEIEDAIELTRTLSTQFAPPFGEKSLRDSLDWLAMKMEEDHDLSVSVLARGPVTISDNGLRMLLFRLVRELLFNVVKHAETDEAQVALVEGEERLRVVVEDEGKGFDPAEQKTRGYGLMNINERIQILGGTVEISSRPGAGTRVAVEVPRSRKDQS